MYHDLGVDIEHISYCLHKNIGVYMEELYQSGYGLLALLAPSIYYLGGVARVQEYKNQFLCKLSMLQLLLIMEVKALNGYGFFRLRFESRNIALPCQGPIASHLVHLMGGGEFHQ